MTFALAWQDTDCCHALKTRFTTSVQQDHQHFAEHDDTEQHYCGKSTAVVQQ